jgi:transcriptional regulator GlxA family with amidase domain
VRTQRVCEYIASNLERKIRLETLAEMGALSVRHFSRPFQTKSSYAAPLLDPSAPHPACSAHCSK